MLFPRPNLAAQLEIVAMHPAMPPPARAPNFKYIEDNNICHAWIEVSTDAAVSTNQSGETFMRRLKAIFHARMKVKYGLWVFDRSAGSPSSRFQTISHDAAKNERFYKQLIRLNRSGASEEDMKKDALEIYESYPRNKRKFKFLSCWFILKN